MRYYNVVITRADGSPYLFKSLGGLGLTSLLPMGPQNPQSGLTNPSALQIEFDLSVFNGAAPDTNGYFRVWGLGLEDIGSASDLNGLDVSIYAGMARGLPLANPMQAGLIMQGTVLQGFGNWVGTTQTIDMIFVAGGTAAGSQDAPGNFPFSMPAGTPLARAIANTLSIAMPNLPPTISISPNLILNYDVTGHYPSLVTFASFIKALSHGIIGGTDYQGVAITSDGQTISVFDGAGPAPITGVKAIAFQDLIGQPTWIDGGTVSVRTVMRADVGLGDTISIPPSLFTVGGLNSAQYLSGMAKDKSTFSGNYLVQQVHQYGNFRQADSASWASVFQVTPA